MALSINNSIPKKKSGYLFNSFPFLRKLFPVHPNGDGVNSPPTENGTNPQWAIPKDPERSTAKGKELDNLKNEITMANAGLYCLAAKILENEQ